MPTRLIMNGDDFGISRGVTDGILLAHRFGFLTSTSLMANMPAAEYALSRLPEAPGLGVGVHLNVCTGRPLLPACEIPSLVGADGQFLPPRALIRKLWLFQVSPSELEAEFRAQIQWVKERGISPAHVDSHHHLHLYPAAVGPFVRAAAAHGIRCSRAPRITVWPKPRRAGAAHAGPWTRRIAADSYRRFLRAVPLRSLQTADSRIGFSPQGRHAAFSTKDQWRLTIAHLPEGTFEWVSHPGLPEEGFSNIDAIRAQRESDLHCLTSHDLLELIAQRSIRLITYRQLLAEPVSAPIRAAEGALVAKD